MNTISKSRSVVAVNASTYLWTAAFVAGNVVLPMICHAVNLGGMVFLPLMLFTVIAAARLGTIPAIMTVILSPLLSMAITGMPAAGVMLISFMAHALIVAAAIGTWKQYKGGFTALNIVALLACAHLAAFIVNGIVFFTFDVAWGFLLMSWPGVLIQAFAFWAVTRK